MESNENLAILLRETFSPVNAFGDLDTPLTTTDIQKRLYEDYGSEIDAFLLIKALKDVGFESQRVDDQLFWLIL